MLNKVLSFPEKGLSILARQHRAYLLNLMTSRKTKDLQKIIAKLPSRYIDDEFAKAVLPHLYGKEVIQLFQKTPEPLKEAELFLFYKKLAGMEEETAFLLLISPELRKAQIVGLLDLRLKRLFEVLNSSEEERKTVKGRQNYDGMERTIKSFASELTEEVILEVLQKEKWPMQNTMDEPATKMAIYFLYRVLPEKLKTKAVSERVIELTERVDIYKYIPESILNDQMIMKQMLKNEAAASLIYRYIPDNKKSVFLAEYLLNTNHHQPEDILPLIPAEQWVQIWPIVKDKLKNGNQHTVLGIISAIADKLDTDLVMMALDKVKDSEVAVNLYKDLPEKLKNKTITSKIFQIIDLTKLNKDRALQLLEIVPAKYMGPGIFKHIMKNIFSQITIYNAKEIIKELTAEQVILIKDLIVELFSKDLLSEIYVPEEEVIDVPAKTHRVSTSSESVREFGEVEIEEMPAETHIRPAYYDVKRGRLLLLFLPKEIQAEIIQRLPDIVQKGF